MGEADRALIKDNIKRPGREMLDALYSKFRLGPLLGLRIQRKCRPALGKQETLKHFSLTALGYLGQGTYKKNPRRIP